MSNRLGSVDNFIDLNYVNQQYRRGETRDVNCLKIILWFGCTSGFNQLFYIHFAEHLRERSGNTATVIESLPFFHNLNYLIHCSNISFTWILWQLD